MPNFIEIKPPRYNTTSQKIPIDGHSCYQFSVYAGMDHRRSAVMVRWKNITILGWHYSDTNSPYNPKISRSVASYIAARRDLTRNLHCYKLPCYVPAKLASWPCRPWMALKFESSLSRPLKLKRALLRNDPPDSYYIFTTSKQTCRWCTG